MNNENINYQRAISGMNEFKLAGELEEKRTMLAKMENKPVTRDSSAECLKLKREIVMIAAEIRRRQGRISPADRRQRRLSRANQEQRRG